MNITKEQTGDLTATIKVEMGPEDYQEQVTNALKEVQKKSTLKGFRPGKVPFGLIRKMYGKSVLAEEINKILSESLNNYIVENKLEILGYPLAGKDRETKADFDSEEAFEFYFDIGLTPEIELEINDSLEADYFDIEVEDEKVDAYLKDVRTRYGDPVNPDKTEKGDLIKGDIEQVDDNGEPLEDGVKNNTSLSIDFIKDEEAQKQFIGRAVGDQIRFNPLSATGNEAETASMLGVKKENQEQMGADYRFTISEISRIEPAEVNQEFFKKVYPNDDIESEEAFREKLRAEAKDYFQKESDQFFTHDVIEHLVHDTDINLPEEFLKRWLIESESKITEENVGHEFDNYVHAMKQQLIINKIARDNDIRVERNDIREYIKQSYAKQFMFDLNDEEKSKQLDPIADAVMKNDKEAQKIYEQLFDSQMRAVFKSKMKVNKVPVTYDDFVKRVNEHHQKHHHHEHAE